MAHALLGYDGLCENIHGHSYVLWVSIIGEPINDEANPKNGMVMDFSVLSKIVKTQIIEVFDHSLVLNNNTPKGVSDIFVNNSNKLILVNYQPTCENLIKEFSEKILKMLPRNVVLNSLKLQETETSYAEWFAIDN